MRIYLICLPVLCALSACAGYKPLYGQVDQTRIAPGEIRMQITQRDIGERRVAQQVYQQLLRAFTTPANAKYLINAVIEETQGTLSVQRDATIQRASVNLEADVTLVNQQTNSPVHTFNLTATSAYNTEDNPFATESGRMFAREAAAQTLADDLTSLVLLWLRDHAKQDAASPE